MKSDDERQQELEKEILEWAEEYASEHGYVLNRDETQLSAVIRGLARNQVRHGERYCPCRLRSGKPEEDQKIICPCIYHQDEIADDGNCHCHLFFKK